MIDNGKSKCAARVLQENLGVAIVHEIIGLMIRLYKIALRNLCRTAGDGASARLPGAERSGGRSRIINPRVPLGVSPTREWHL